MVLDPATMKPAAERAETGQVYLYNFGGVVFLDCPDPVIASFALRMSAVIDAFREFAAVRHQDRYSLRIGAGKAQEISNEGASVPRFDSAFVDIVAFVLAKSVALERIEDQVDKVFDEMEGLIARLRDGNLNLPLKRLAKSAAEILNFKYRSIAYVMILDKPEITWDNQEADRFYVTMANLFELNQRYLEIRHKSETLLDITDVFSTLSHARRGFQLEMIIIVLIVIEIVIYVLEILPK
ncbi:RMD1 family protein [Geomonas sp. Red875]|uniref:RMD1 family protein n=2 Tax=Geomesophilobacter sediminis TaxID=2798584 RepID=A0A8J7LY44_9BACT|nr:RMD1 family protein [Geomesophilobacter sediminis]